MFKTIIEVSEIDKKVSSKMIDKNKAEEVDEKNGRKQKNEFCS